jgi:hypothetical protein
MRRDGDLDGRELADARRSKLRARAPVEREARQMEQEVDDPGLFLRSHGKKPSQESRDLVADAGKPRDRREKRVEERRPHGGHIPARAVLRLLMLSLPCMASSCMAASRLASP